MYQGRDLARVSAPISRAGEVISAEEAGHVERKHTQATDQDQQTCDGRSRNAPAGRLAYMSEIANVEAQLGISTVFA